MRANPIRFTGMASGMDTDSIVRDMMRPQKYKIDQEKKAQALVQLRQDAWKDLNKKLSDFHRNYTEKMSRGSFEKNDITSSNPDVISIDDNVKVPEGTHTFEVTQIAQSASTVGQIDGGNKVPATTTVKDLMKDFTIFDKLVMTVNGKPITVAIKAEDTLSDLAENMNAALKEGKTGFTAKYDEANGSLFISSTVTGKDQSISFSKDNSEGAKLFKELGLERHEPVTGKDAIYTYNGGDFTSSSNKIEVNGIKANLRSASNGDVTISSVTDPDATYDFIKEFITEYNKLIDELNEKLDTRPAKDIMPLTSEERDAMSESDIKLWEDKLNSSLFYQDTDLANFVGSARRTLGQVLKDVDKGDHNSLASVGIITGLWQEKGKLYIVGDEDSGVHASKTNKLREALAEDPNKVTKFFRKMGSELYATHNKAFTTGNNLKSAMSFYNDKLMVDKVKSYEERISVLEERMYKMEDIQYAKFAAMEKMLSRLNSQGDWLMQQFGGM